MKRIRLRLDVWLLVFIQLHANLFLCIEDVFREIPDLNALCPNTSFCSLNPSATYAKSELKQPCCQSCFCDHDCDLRGDCCFSHLDKYFTDSDKRVVCKSAFVAQSLIKEGTILNKNPYGHHYRMINKCSHSIPDSGMNAPSCEHNSSNALEAYHPVVSTDTGFIYVNADCAHCNNESDLVPWRRVVTCSQNNEGSLSDSIENLMLAKTLFDFGCFVYYIPPLGYEIVPSVPCDPHVIRRCGPFYENVTKDQNRKFCEMYNATFVFQVGAFVRLFANVHCFLCNSMQNEDDFMEKPHQTCIKYDELTTEKLVLKSRLTVLFDLPESDGNFVTQRKDEKNDCTVNSVKVASFDKSCRPRRCPWGQILINNRCDYYSKKWVGGPFVVTLRLTPVKKKEQSIPVSFFEDLPEHYKNDKRALWIKRKTLTRWRFFVMYTRYKDEPAIDYLVVRATYPSASLNPHHLKTSVKRAIEDIWEIYFKGSSFAFHVDFHEYFQFEPIQGFDFKKTGINRTHNFGGDAYYPMWLHCQEGCPSSENYNINDFLFPVSSFYEEFNKEIFITKLLFCDQVDLLADEIEHMCFNILYRGIRIHTYNIIKSTSLTPFGTNQLNARICLDEFERIYNSAIETRYHFIVFIQVLLQFKVYCISFI